MSSQETLERIAKRDNYEPSQRRIHINAGLTFTSLVAAAGLGLTGYGIYGLIDNGFDALSAVIEASGLLTFGLASAPLAKYISIARNYYRDIREGREIDTDEFFYMFRSVVRGQTVLEEVFGKPIVVLDSLVEIELEPVEKGSDHPVYFIDNIVLEDVNHHTCCETFGSTSSGVAIDNWYGWYEFAFSRDGEYRKFSVALKGGTPIEYGRFMKMEGERVALMLNPSVKGGDSVPFFVEKIYHPHP